MKQLRIEHLTEYEFSEPTTLYEHRMLLRPRVDHHVRIVTSRLSISPTPTLRWKRDPLDNSVAIACFAQRASLLSIASSVIVEHYDQVPLDFVVDERAVTHPFAYDTTEAVLLAPFMEPSWPMDAIAIERWLERNGIGGGTLETFVLLQRLSQAVHADFSYQARETAGVQSPATTLELGSGSCRDLAAFFIDACRVLKLAARFVSGYLHCDPDLVSRNPGATHAWAEVYLPGPGWKGFDPTIEELASSRHIAVAVAQHPEHVPPVAGSFFGFPSHHPTLRVAVQVEDWPPAR